MPTLTEKTEKEIILDLVDSLDSGTIQVKLSYDCSKGAYVTVSLSSNDDDHIIKPTIEYVNSFDDISRVVTNYITKDVLEFAKIEL